MSHVDEFAIITNGILTRNDSIYRIIDPLGYFVIQVAEEVVEDVGGGGALDFRYDPNQQQEPQKKSAKKKIITITVTSQENGINYTEQLEVKDIDLKVTKVKLIDGIIYLTLYNPILKEETFRQIKVRNVKE